MVKFSDLVIFGLGKVLINHDLLNFFDGRNLIVLHLRDGLFKHVVIQFDLAPHLGFELCEESSVQPFPKFDEKLLLHVFLKALDNSFCVWLGALDGGFEHLAFFSKFFYIVLERFTISTTNFQVNFINDGFDLCNNFRFWKDYLVVS